MADKLIFFDIDGTLLSPTSFKFEESTQRVLKQLQEKGYKLGIATGRSYEAAKSLGTFELVDWDILVLNNGQRVVNKKHQVIFEEAINPDTIANLLSMAHDKKIAILGQGNRWHLYSEVNDYVREVHHELGSLPIQEKFDPTEKIFTLLVYGYDYSIIDHFKDLRYVHVTGPYADVTLKNSHKYKGIQKAMQELNVDEYMAMGDSANDLEMAQHAKLFIATHQSFKGLLPYTDYHVKSEGDEVEKGIEWLLNHNSL